MRKICAVDGCDLYVHGCGFCNTHYRQMQRSGKIKHKRTASNEKEVDGDRVLITIYGRFHDPLSEKVIIDLADLPLVEGKRVTYSYTRSSRRAEILIKGKNVRLHRYLMSAPKGMIVDHINGNQFDNRRSNLRMCGQQQNNWNRTTAKGVVQLPYGKWMAQICRDYKRRYLGTYDTKEEAIEARRTAEKELFGEFAAQRSE